MGGSKKREKEGLWLSWKEAIQQTTLEEEQLRDLMLSQYSYASIPYKNKRQVASAGESGKPPQEKEQEKVRAIQVEEETPSLQKDRKAKTILQVQLPEVEVEKVKRTGTEKRRDFAPPPPL